MWPPDGKVSFCRAILTECECGRCIKVWWGRGGGVGRVGGEGGGMGSSCEMQVWKYSGEVLKLQSDNVATERGH